MRGAKAAGGAAQVLTGWFLVEFGFKLTVIALVLSWKMLKIMVWVTLLIASYVIALVKGISAARKRPPIAAAP